MKKKGYHQLLREAWQFSCSSRYAWLFAAFIALSLLGQNKMLLAIIPPPPVENWQAFFETVSSSDLGRPLIIIGLFFLVRFFGTGNLIDLLGHAIKKSPASPPAPRLTGPRLIGNWWRVLTVALSTFLFLLFLALIFSLPSLVAAAYRPAALDSLLAFSAWAFLIVGFFAYFVLEFALFYRIIAGLTLRASLEMSYVIFVRHLWRTLGFGVYVFALFLLFTFFLNLFILVLGELVGSSLILSWVISAFFLTWFSIMYQALWFFFFRDIAALPAPPEEKTKVVVPENVPEIPPAADTGV